MGINGSKAFGNQMLRSSVDDSLEDRNGQQEQFEQTTTVATTIHGAYVIVDNDGYLDWSTTVPPIKKSNNRAEIWFLQWLELLQKDVECAFGLLKAGRWRVLKTGIQVNNTEAADNMWLTCCALHNMLLDIDVFVA